MENFKLKTRKVLFFLSRFMNDFSNYKITAYYENGYGRTGHCGNEEIAAT
jgi:hypothetical protein